MRRFPYEPTAYDDDWEDQPGQGPQYKWGLGVLRRWRWLRMVGTRSSCGKWSLGVGCR